MTRVVAYVPDLMDRSKVAAALSEAEVTFVDTPAKLMAPADLAIVDLSRPGVLEALPRLAAAGVRTIGYVSHVDRERAAAASSAGCDQVYARSAFFGQIGELLGDDRA